MPHSEQLQRLDQLLTDYQWLWLPQPFKQHTPDWCSRLPELNQQLLALDDLQLSQLQKSDVQLMTLLMKHLPELGVLSELTQLTAAQPVALKTLNPRFHSAIPGRKWQQIQAFCGALGQVERPLLEWCGGKGHLGRLLAAQWQQPVTTIEWGDKLCDAGEQLAERSKVKQRFKVLDVLSSLPNGLFQKQHAVALHACGELHRTLVRQTVAHKLPELSIAPCCYYRIKGSHYQPFTQGLRLPLDKNGLRLAVTEAVTASARELRLRDQEMAWKLGYEQILQQWLGLPYQPIKPINKQWLRENFAGFCQNLAQRDGHPLSSEIDWTYYQQQGEQRQQQTMRLNLPRFAFRRAIEMWLVLDMACYLEQSGYNVEMSHFCERAVTPRNILLSASRI